MGSLHIRLEKLLLQLLNYLQISDEKATLHGVLELPVRICERESRPAV